MQTLPLVTTANIASWSGTAVALLLGGFSIFFSVKANRRSARIESRDTEVRDVEWRGNWTKPDLYELVNAGTTSAHDVEATLVVDGERFVVRKKTVLPNGKVSFQVPAVAEKLEVEKREHASYGKIADVYGPPHVNVQVEVRITWQSPLSVPGSDQFRQGQEIYDRPEQ